MRQEDTLYKDLINRIVCNNNVRVFQSIKCKVTDVNLIIYTSKQLYVYICKTVIFI